MNHEPTSSSKTGPKACTTCAKAKARCNPGPKGGICERCHRLHKPCSAQTPAPPRKRKAPKHTRVAELEKRLEDLTARIETQQPRSPTPTNVHWPLDVQRLPQQEKRRASFTPYSKHKAGDHLFPPGSPDYNHRDHDGEHASKRQRQTAHDGDVPAQRIRRDHGVERGTVSLGRQPQSQGPQSAAEADSCPSLSAPTTHGVTTGSESSQRYQSPWQVESSYTESASPLYYPSPEEAQQCLRKFNVEVLPLFPFIVIPPNTTSESLRRDKPLLWKAIMMESSSLHAKRQGHIGDALLREIVTASFIQAKKSLDLLQALQVLVAWSHSSTKSFELTNLLFLMRSICVSLGFNESQQISKQQSSSPTSLEHMRTFAGTYYVVTMIFTTAKKPDAFMNTTYLDHCCRKLEERMEYPTDRLAVLLVRTQQIAQSISMTLAFRNNQHSLPLPLVVQSFQNEMNQLRSTVPENLRDNCMLKTQMYIAETLLYEVGISEDLSAGLTPTYRLELLWECLVAARSMLETRFHRPDDGETSEFPKTTSLSSFDYTYAMLVCLKLSLMQLPGWDLRVVRKEFDFDRYLALQILDLRMFTAKRSQQHAISYAGDTSKETVEFLDPYLRLVARLSQLRTCIMAELAATLPPESQQPEAETVPQSVSLSSLNKGVSGPDVGTVLGGPPLSENFPEFENIPGVYDLDLDNFQLFEDLPGFDDPFWQDMYKVNA